MTRLLMTAVLLLTGVTASAQDAGKVDADAKKVIEKAIEAHGGKEALEKYPATTAKMKGQLSVFGLDIPFEGDMVNQRPDKARVAMTIDVQGQKVELVQVVNGDKVKVVGSPQEPTDSEKDELKLIPVLAEVTAFTPLLKGDKFSVKAEKDEKVDDAEAAVVSVSAEGLKEIRLFFDKKSGLLVKTSRKTMSPAAPGAEPAEVTEESFLTDYKTVEGVKLPTKTKVLHDGKPFMTITMTDMKMMDKAEAKSFAIDD